ncbi:filament-like plant protein 3 isoform X2 [Curcuma longa]|uniref:filament-like plant protein 3 isoform X2 n=1 Tax=Curcuma longa TaxID=136217 RepID=UPI003D9E70BB
MDRRSWLWRRKSSEKSLGETESSGSVSPQSERYSDDQDALRTSPNDTSASHAQSPEVASNTCDTEVDKTVKRLTEKLSAALLNISAKEELVKQHAKVAEEAVSGWEQAEAEVATLKQQLETAVDKNTSLEDRISQLDRALKECVSQFHQFREDQEEKVHNLVTSKGCEGVSEKYESEKQLAEIKPQIDAVKIESTTLDHGLHARFETVEKENMALKTEVHSLFKHLQVLLLERELSNKAAETASKQLLDSIKKITKLEAECRRLLHMNRKLSSTSVPKLIGSSICVESLTDSQSDSGDRLPGTEIELGRSDSWASALLAELDQFKGEKPTSRIIDASVEIELMDDFLEMERFVALPESDPGIIEPGDKSFQVIKDDLQIENEIMDNKLIMLEEKVEKLGYEKEELRIALAESHCRLEVSCNLLAEAENKIVEMQTKMDLANESKASTVVDLEGMWKELETQLELAYLENGKLCEKISLLEESLEADRILSAEHKAKVEIAEVARRELDSQLKSALREVGTLNEQIGVLECQLKEGRALSSELSAKVDSLEATNKALKSQLDHANSEVRKLKEKVNFWELQAVEETKLSTEYALKLEAAEVAAKKLEFDLKSAHEFANKVQAAEVAKMSVEIQLQSAHLELQKLSDKVVFLEKRVDEERALSAEYAAQCRKLEGEFFKMNREVDGWRASRSSRELKIKQERELAVAAGKLEECQKTIASLNQQLKLLTTFDGLILEAETPGYTASIQDHDGSITEIEGFFSSNDPLEVF